MPQFKTAVFDLDGTILNTLGDLTASTNYMLSQKGFPGRTEDEVRRFVGNGTPRLIERALPVSLPEREFADCVAVYKKHYREHVAVKTVPYNGMPLVIKQLKERGVRMGVASNKFDSAVKLLCERFYPGLFEAAIGESENVPKKPDPLSTRMVLETLGSDGSDAVYIGDSETDAATAKNAGLPLISVSWGFRDLSVLQALDSIAVLSSPEELLGYFI